MGKRDTLILSILTLVTALAWIAFDVYHASVSSTVSPEVEAQLSVITPKFDRATIEKVKGRQFVDPFATQGIRTIVPTPIPQISSPSAGISTATESAGR